MRKLNKYGFFKRTNYQNGSKRIKPFGKVLRFPNFKCFGGSVPTTSKILFIILFLLLCGSARVYKFVLDNQLTLSVTTSVSDKEGLPGTSAKV